MGGVDEKSDLITIDGTMELCGDLGIDPENVSSRGCARGVEAC